MCLVASLSYETTRGPRESAETTREMTGTTRLAIGAAMAVIYHAGCRHLHSRRSFVQLVFLV